MKQNKPDFKKQKDSKDERTHDHDNPVICRKCGTRIIRYKSPISSFYYNWCFKCNYTMIVK